MNREYRLAAASDFVAIGRMLELYQYELTDIWDQDLDAKGEYGFDLDRHVRAERSFAYVALVEGRSPALALVARRS